jgi:putative transposase
MKRSKFSEEQIVCAIRQADAGTPVGDFCRQLGVSEPQRLRQLEEENGRLKRLVADPSLGKHMLSEDLRKKSLRPARRRRRRLLWLRSVSERNQRQSTPALSRFNTVLSEPLGRSARLGGSDLHYC